MIFSEFPTVIFLDDVEISIKKNYWFCGLGSHMVFFLHDRALAGILCGLCLPTVVSGSIPGPI